jgi:hypothetical protein
MSGTCWARVPRAFRRVALPLASYYAVTLALPLANGAAPSGAFMEHAVVVLVVPPIAIILGCAVHTIAHALARLWNTTSRHRREQGPRRMTKSEASTFEESDLRRRLQVERRPVSWVHLQ